MNFERRNQRKRMEFDRLGRLSSLKNWPEMVVRFLGLNSTTRGPPTNPIARLSPGEETASDDASKLEERPKIGKVVGRTNSGGALLLLLGLQVKVGGKQHHSRTWTL